LLLNITSALGTLAGALVSFFFWDFLSPWQPHLLAFTAGMFIYIAGSDLIPELHFEYKKERAWLHTAAFVVGIFFTLLVGMVMPHE
jgi:zinc and cadmium transporter